MDLVNSEQAASDKGRMASQIWSRLERGRTATLLKIQRSRLSIVIRVITGQCIIGTNARYIGLGHIVNDFCKSYGHQKEVETFFT